MHSSVTDLCSLLPWNPVHGWWFSSHLIQKDQVAVSYGAYSSLLLTVLAFHPPDDECAPSTHEAKLLLFNSS